MVSIILLSPIMDGLQKREKRVHVYVVTVTSKPVAVNILAVIKSKMESQLWMMTAVSLLCLPEDFSAHTFNGMSSQNGH